MTTARAQANNRIHLRVHEDTDAALRAYAERQGLSLAAAAEDVITLGLRAAAAAEVGETALPLVEAAIRGVLADEIVLALAPIRDALRAVHDEATLARLETYAGLAHAHGADAAARAEDAAQRQIVAARATGATPRLRAVARGRVDD